MKDAISQTRLDQLHPKVRADFQKFIEEAESSLNIVLRITQGMRTMEEQQALYNKGRTTSEAIVTNAKAGSSYHNYGLAIDLVRMDGNSVDWEYDMKKLLPFATKYEIAWGGSWKKFKDKPHFEKRFGLNWRELFQRYEDKIFITGTKFVNL